VDGREKMRWIQLNQDYIKRWEKKALKTAEDNGICTNVNTKPQLLFLDLPTNVEINEITDEGIDVAFTNSLGYFSGFIPLNVDQQIELLKANINRFNKIKTVLEATK